MFVEEIHSSDAEIMTKSYSLLWGSCVCSSADKAGSWNWSGKSFLLVDSSVSGGVFACFPFLIWQVKFNIAFSYFPDNPSLWNWSTTTLSDRNQTETHLNLYWTKLNFTISKWKSLFTLKLINLKPDILQLWNEMWKDYTFPLLRCT